MALTPTTKRSSALDAHFEKWARWVHTGQVTTASSIMQKIMEGGSFNRGGAGSSPIIDCVELNVESALLRLQVSCETAVVVCRVEYGAERIKNLPIDASRETRALRLGMSLRTYNRRLKAARDHVETALIKSGDL